MKNNKELLGADAAAVESARSAEAAAVAPHVAPVDPPVVTAASASQDRAWRVVNHPYQGREGQLLDDWCVEDSTGERIVEVYKSDGLDEPRAFPAKERAHLIAASPELYEAGAQIRAECAAVQYEKYVYISRESFNTLMAALRKAEGRS